MSGLGCGLGWADMYIYAGWAGLLVLLVALSISLVLSLLSFPLSSGIFCSSLLIFCGSIFVAHNNNNTVVSLCWLLAGWLMIDGSLSMVDVWWLMLDS